MESRQFRIIAALLGLIGAALVALILVLIFGDGDDAAGPTTTAPASTTTSPPGTNAGATTITPPATTSTIAAPATTTAPTTTAAPATTAAPTTTTATTEPPTTTTTTEPPPAPLVLQDDGIGGVPFGTDPAATIAYAEAVLGPAGNDTGWIDSFSKYGTCPGDVVRGVEWAVDDAGYGFVLLFTQVPTDHLPGGGPHLFGYSYFGDPMGLETEGGITVGSTLGEALAAHPGSTVEEHPLVPGSGIWTLDVSTGDDALLWGFADGAHPGDELTSLNGGVTCGE